MRVTSVKTFLTIAYTQSVPTERNFERRVAGFNKWRLMHSRVKYPRFEARIISARTVTVAEKPAFREAFRLRWCLVFVDAFYEWQPNGTVKRPMHIVMQTSRPFAFAVRGRCGGTGTATESHHGRSSPRRRMICSGLSATGCW